MGSSNKEIIEYLNKILSRVEYIQSTVNEHSKDFTQIHSEIGTYRSEILSFSTNLRQLEKEYTVEKKRFEKADYMLETYEKSIAEISSIKSKVHSCTYCNRHHKDEIGSYIG